MNGRPQSGFTLIELLAASAATGVIILAASAFMLKALSWFDIIHSKIEMNRHARETFDLLAYGGVSSTAGKDGTDNLYGIRGSNAAPPNGLRSNGALQYTDNKLTLTPDTFAATTITCTGSGTPIPDCKNAPPAPPPGPGPAPPAPPGSTVTMTGWIGSDIQLTGGGQSVNNLTVAVTFTITDSFQAQRGSASAPFSDTYHTIFSLNRDEPDPH